MKIIENKLILGSLAGKPVQILYRSRVLSINSDFDFWVIGIKYEDGRQ